MKLEGFDTWCLCLPVGFSTSSNSSEPGKCLELLITFLIMCIIFLIWHITYNIPDHVYNIYEPRPTIPDHMYNIPDPLGTIPESV